MTYNATRIGMGGGHRVGTIYKRNGRDHRTCVRCSIEFEVKSARPAELCRDCRSVETPSLSSRALDMHDAGLTIQEISDALDRPRKVVQTVLRDATLRAER